MLARDMDRINGPLLALLFGVVSLAGCIGGDELPGSAAEEDESKEGELELGQIAPDESALTGQVISDALDYLEEATVVIEGLGLNTTTNAQGRFQFEGLEPGTYAVFAQADGYQVQRETVEFVAGRAAEVNFILDRVPTQRPHISVLDQAGFLECQTPMFAVTMNCVPIQNVLNDLGTNPTNTEQILKWEFETDGLEYIVVEMVWDPSLGQTAQDLGVWFEVDSTDLVEGETYAFAHGPSPVRMEIFDDEDDDVLTQVRNSNATVYQTRTFPVGIPVSTPLVNLSAPAPDRFVFMQKFTIFISLFYYQLPTPGYSGVPDEFDP